MLSISLFVCLSVAKMQTTRFSQKLSTSDSELWSLLTTYRKSHMGFSKNQYYGTPKILDLDAKMQKLDFLKNEAI